MWKAVVAYVYRFVIFVTTLCFGAATLHREGNLALFELPPLCRSSLSVPQDGLLLAPPQRCLKEEMILSQSSAGIGNRCLLFRPPGVGQQIRFAPARRYRNLRSVTVFGLPEQSAGLLFKGGASGDVGSFSAPVGTLHLANIARLDQVSTTSEVHCHYTQTMKTFSTLVACETS